MANTSVQQRRYLQILAHLLGWALLVFITTMPFTDDFTISNYFWVKYILQLSLLVCTFYFNSNVLIPNLLFSHKKTVQYVLSVVACVVAVSFINYRLDDLLGLEKLVEQAFDQIKKLQLPIKHPLPIGSWPSRVFPVVSSLVILGFSTSITVINKWYEDAEVQKELEKEKISSELSFLKTQINPHFFFNTLNNIYALTLIDGEQAREAIHKLSRLMRYVLYDTQHESTSLSKEIDFMKDYVQLMKLRLSSSVEVNFSYPAHYRDVSIAPMILLPFVENTFKHGVSNIEKSQIEISLEQTNDTVVFRTENNLLTQKSTSVEEPNGIGLTNTRRRLDLLYPMRHRLEVSEDEKKYRVRLEINTNPQSNP